MSLFSSSFYDADNISQIMYQQDYGWQMINQKGTGRKRLQGNQGSTLAEGFGRKI
jgi:hypothetical protein